MDPAAPISDHQEFVADTPAQQPVPPPFPNPGKRIALMFAGTIFIFAGIIYGAFTVINGMIKPNPGAAGITPQVQSNKQKQAFLPTRALNQVSATLPPAHPTSQPAATSHPTVTLQPTAFPSTTGRISATPTVKAQTVLPAKPLSAIQTKTPSHPPINTTRTTALFRADSKQTGSFKSETKVPKGTLKWKLKYGKSGASSVPIVANGITYFGSYDKKIYAVDTLTGKTLWTYPMLVYYPMYVDDKYLYAGHTDIGEVSAIDLKTYKEIWKFSLDSIPSSNPNKSKNSIKIASGITGADGIIYFSGTNGILYALDSGTGKIKWTFETHLSFRIPEASVDNGIVYVTNDEGYIHALDGMTGSEKWRFQFGKSVNTTAVAIENDTGYFVAQGQYLIAVDLKNGKLKWYVEFKQDKKSNIGVSAQTVAVTDGKIYLSGVKDSTLEIFDINGKATDTFTANEWIESTAAIAGNILYVSTYNRAQDNNGYLYAVDIKTLKVLWKFNPDTSGIVKSPVIADGIIYFKSEDGTIYAVE